MAEDLPKEALDADPEGQPSPTENGQESDASQDPRPEPGSVTEGECG